MTSHDWITLGGLVFTILTASYGLLWSFDRRFASLDIKINTLLEGDVRELKSRIRKLEAGQDEWTKALRVRTHDLADELNILTLKLDRLERPRKDT